MNVNIPEDITKHEENILMGMNMRQTAFSVVGVALISVSFFFTEKTIISEVASWLAIFLGAPCFLFAFYTRDGLPLEKFLMIYLRFKLISYRKRKFIAENEFYDLFFKADEVTAKKGIKEKKTGETAPGKKRGAGFFGNKKRRK